MKTAWACLLVAAALLAAAAPAAAQTDPIELRTADDDAAGGEAVRLGVTIDNDGGAGDNSEVKLYTTFNANSNRITSLGAPTGANDAARLADIVRFAPASAQADASANPSMWINDTGGGNLLQLQVGGVDRFVVSGAGTVTSGAWNGSTIGVAYGGTGATSFAAGSVVFSDGTILTQDNANLFWNDATDRLGIGTSNPGQALSVVGTIESTSGGFKFPDGTTQTTAAGGVGGGWTDDGSVVRLATTTDWVGIGTSLPAARFQVGATVGVGGSLIWSQQWGGDPPNAASGSAIDDTGIYLVSSANGDMAWHIAKRSLLTGASLWSVTDNVTVGAADILFDIATDGTYIYVVGIENDEVSTRIQKRQASNGALVASVSANFAAGVEDVRNIAIDTSGIYIAGAGDDGGGDWNWKMRKYDLNLALIWTQTSNEFSTAGTARAVAADASSLYVAGDDNELGNRQWRVEKRSLSDGTLIAAFGTGGVLQVNPSIDSDVAYGVAVDGTGLYIAGTDTSLGAGATRWRIDKRDLTTGALLWTQVESLGTFDPAQYDAPTPYDVAAWGDSIYVGGFDYVLGASNSRWRAERRWKSDGTIVWIENVDMGGSTYDRCTNVEVHATGVYLVGDSYFPPWNVRIERRSLAGVQGLVVADNGFVGIGTPTPNYQLELSTDSAAKPGTNTWTVPSDRRLKTDIAPFADGLDVLRQLHPVRYRYNGTAGMPTDREYIGIIAQEVERVAPYSITTFRSRLDPQDERETELLSFDSSPITFVTINAIQELDDALVKLRGELAELRADKERLNVQNAALGARIRALESALRAMSERGREPDPQREPGTTDSTPLPGRTP